MRVNTYRESPYIQNTPNLALNEIEIPPLNEEQQVIFDNITETINNIRKDYKFKREIVITAPAGGGKTYLTGAIIKWLAKYSYSIVCTSTTHKAVSVLKKHINNIDIPIRTIHSFLNLEPQIDYETGKIKFVKSKYISDDGSVEPNVLIIDEASMVSNELLKYVKEKMEAGVNIIIYVGDKYQLPPVDDKNNAFAIFKPDENKDIYELKNVVRQDANNPIIKLSRLLVQNIKYIMGECDERQFQITSKDLFNKVISHTCEKYPNYFTLYSNVNKLKDEYIKLKIEQENNDMFDYLYAAYSNKAVDYINRYVRKIDLHLKGIYNYDILVPEDILVLSAPVHGTATFKISNINDAISSAMPPVIVFSNGEIINITNVSDVHVAEFFGIEANRKPNVYNENERYILKYHRVEFKESQNSSLGYNIIKPDEENFKVYNFISNSLKSAALNTTDDDIRKKIWIAYYNFKNTFISYKFSYASTLHKLQGSTIEKEIFLDFSSLPWHNLEFALRLAYVGITRTRNKCSICL